MMAAAVLTTGPVIYSAGVGSLFIKLLNNTGSTQMVRKTLFDISQCPKQATGGTPTTTTFPGECSDLETFDTGPGGLDLEQFEVQIEFLGDTQGIFAFVASAQAAQF